MIPFIPHAPHAATARSSFSVAAWLLCACSLVACSNTAPAADPAAGSATPVASSSSGPTIVAAPKPDASVPLDAAALETDAGVIDASIDADIGDADAADGSTTAAPRPFVADNKVLPPLVSDELNAKAKKLFEAIVRDDPAIGEGFWFPKEPFIPLKDVKGPGKYWDNLHATYVRDIHALHRKRKSWEGATFVGIKLGSPPKWVPPGDEANKIGYYRTFRAKLTYKLDDKTWTLEVHTIISWQGEWFITHLSKFKKK